MSQFELVLDPYWTRIPPDYSNTTINVITRIPFSPFYHTQEFESESALLSTVNEFAQEITKTKTLSDCLSEYCNIITNSGFFESTVEHASLVAMARLMIDQRDGKDLLLSQRPGSIVRVDLDLDGRTARIYLHAAIENYLFEQARILEIAQDQARTLLGQHKRRRGGKLLRNALTGFLEAPNWTNRHEVMTEMVNVGFPLEEVMDFAMASGAVPFYAEIDLGRQKPASSAIN